MLKLLLIDAVGFVQRYSDRAFCRFRVLGRRHGKYGKDELEKRNDEITPNDKWNELDDYDSFNCKSQFL